MFVQQSNSYKILAIFYPCIGMRTILPGFR